MSLEERLRTHTSAFDGLLSLIPSKYYEDAGDGDDQWRKKKQSKEEKRKAKRAKLDPSNQTASNAKDIQDAKNSKEKAVIPTKESIKEKMEMFNTVEVEEEEEGKGKKGNKKADKKDNKKGNKAGEKAGENGKDKNDTKTPVSKTPTSKTPTPKTSKSKDSKPNAKVNGTSTTTEDSDAEIEAAPFSDLVDEEIVKSSEKELSAEEEATKKAEEEAKEARLAALREKLNSKIQNMRADRKAPGTDPKKAPQSRAEILAARQKAKEARKEKKKLEREERKNKGDEAEVEVEEDESASETDEPNLLYSQLHFETGEFSSDLKNLTSKKEGTKRDLLGQLNHVKAKRAKLQEMDLDKKKSVENATLWNRAMQHAKGEKVRDNEKLLTKAFKRQQQQKRKSEREWNDRRYTVDKHKRTKDKKRTENLQARRDSKKIKGKKVKPVKKPSSGKRAGFEGRLKSK